MSQTSSHSVDTSSGQVPWLSVLIPVFNVQDYLEDCVQSVMSQLPSDANGVEILLLDDCSTDGSWTLMQALASRWPGRLRLLQHPVNGGLSAARNTLMAAATGDYFWFLDSDDKLLAGAIQGLHAVVAQHPVDVVFCDFQVWRAKERLKHVLRGERHRRTYRGPAGGPQQGADTLIAGWLMTGQLHAWSKIFRRELWGAGAEFPPGRYFEDMAAMPLVALRARSFFYVPQPWVAYRQRGGSILSSMNLRKAADQSGALRAFRLARDAVEGCGAMPGPLRFALAHQCGRNLIGAMRSLQRLAAQEPLAARQTAVAAFRADFEAVSPISVRELVLQYLLRGWWLRAFKLARWAAYQPQ